MHRIALVEDNPDNRMLVVALLEDEYQVDEYEDGPSAIDGMRDHRPDIILLDISLPGMDGVEVLKRVRNSELADVPAIALTAHAMAGDRQKYMDLGFDDYFAKPIVDEEQLFAMIRKLVDGKGQG
ncbi:MAG: response regulator [Deltaproteobacteria bacterium]|nr:response regulator [Deltaproteobacteria bacterium]